MQFQHKRITNPTITHADKVMLALAECVKAIKGLTGGQDKSSPEAKDLQRIVDSTRATLIKQPRQCEEPIRHDEVPQQAALPRVPAALPRVPPLWQWSNWDPTKTTPLPRVPKPTANQQPTINRIAEAARRERSRKRRVGIRQQATTTSDTTTWVRTRSQVATAAISNAPPAMGTRSRSRPSGTPPPTSRTGSALAVKQQRKFRRGFANLTRRVSRLENEIHQAMAVMDNKTGQLLNYRQLMQSDKHKQAWGRSSANKFGRLAQGIGGRIKGTNTIETYGQFVCTVRPEKEESNQTRFTVGGDRINYSGAVATPTAEMLVARMLFNSVISTAGARFMTMDISNFYLNTPLPRPEFIRINLKDIPEEVIIEYDLRKKATWNGSIYIRAQRGMYGLPQAGLLANELLEKRLNKHGYHQSKLVPGLWEARYTTDTLHVGRRRFRGQVCRRGTCKPPQGNP